MLDFEMRQLEYFVTAASTGSYSQAAKQLFVSPQAISKGVQVLEGRIGIALFERGLNGIALTAFGKVFYEEAASVMRSLERLQNIAENYRQEDEATFSVGIHSLCFKEHGGTIDWNDLLEFHERHETIDPSFLELRGDSIIESIASENLDLGISVPPTNFERFEGIPLKHFPMAALVSSRDDYFSARDEVSIEELSYGQLVLFSEEHEFNDVFMEHARREGRAIEVSPLQIRTDSDIDFVINRNLYVIRPLQHALRTTKTDAVRILPVVDAQGDRIKIPLYIFWNKAKKLSPAEQSFVEMIEYLYQ